MRRALFALFSALVLLGSTGCHQEQVRTGNGGCGCGNCTGLLGGLVGQKACDGIQKTRGWRHEAPEIGPQGPPTGSYAYPYYTLHGPRDFLQDNPPSLGR